MTILDYIQRLVLGIDTPADHTELGRLVAYKYPEAFKGYMAVFKLIDRYAIVLTRLTDGPDDTYHAVLRPLTPLAAEDYTP